MQIVTFLIHVMHVGDQFMKVKKYTYKVEEHSCTKDTKSQYTF